MNNARKDGLYLIAIGWVLFVLLSFVIFTRMSISMLDLRVNYFPARVLVHHGDPYNADQVWTLCLREDPVAQAPKPSHELDIIRYNYPPTIFPFSAPFAFLPLIYAQLACLLMEILAFSLAAMAMWQVGARYASRLAGALIGILLSGCAWTAAVGNLAGVVIGLTVITAWCLLERRHEWFGVVTLAAALDIKPHICLFVWIAFLVADRRLRQRALQSMALAIAIGIAGVLWVESVAPAWLSEFRMDLSALVSHGGFNDPGPSSTGGHGLGMIIDLQSALSLIRDDPHFYNTASGLVVAVLFGIFLFAAIKQRKNPESVWFALAVIAPLTMLPFYHRQGDAKLILLSVPACALLWAEKRTLGKIAAAVTLIEFVTIHEIPWTALLELIRHLPPTSNPATRQLILAFQLAPIPLILLGSCVFYLWVYWNRTQVKALTG